VKHEYQNKIVSHLDLMIYYNAYMARSRSDVIEIDAPSPPTKIFVPTCKSNQKTSTPISVARAMQRSKIRPSLILIARWNVRITFLLNHSM
jgi:hypothetical protein